MANARLVPSNLTAWPRIRDLLPDQKLIVYHAWATCPSAAGCFLVDLGAWQGQLSISSAALAEALREFERRALLLLDESSGEAFILDWFRWHKFDTGPRQRLLADAIRAIQSVRLKNIVTEKSVGCNSRQEKKSEVKAIEENNNIVVFLEAAGEFGKDLSLGAVSRALGNATEIQARWAGLALKEQAEYAHDPGSLAIGLARLAAKGDVGKPKTVLQEERAQKRQEVDAAYRKQLRDVAASVQPAVVRHGNKLPPLPRALGGRR